MMRKITLLLCAVICGILIALAVGVSDSGWRWAFGIMASVYGLGAVAVALIAPRKLLTRRISNSGGRPELN